MYFLGGSIASRFLPFRLEFAGAIYHLTGRGNPRQKVFFTDADRELFLSTLAGDDRYGFSLVEWRLSETVIR